MLRKPLSYWGFLQVGWFKTQPSWVARSGHRFSVNILSKVRHAVRGLTFIEEHHNLGKGLHEVDVIIAVLLDLKQQVELRLTLGGEGFQQKAVLL